MAGNWHHGDDIFAPLGAPLLACADGTVFSVGWNDVGGNRLWLRDSQGNEFYYAHLSAFSPLAKNGRHVKAGEVLGFVGNTGDAQSDAAAPALRGASGRAALHGLRRRRRPDGLPRGLEAPPGRALLPNVAGWLAKTGSRTRLRSRRAILLQVSDISEASGLDPGSLQRAMAARGAPRAAAQVTRFSAAADRGRRERP